LTCKAPNLPHDISFSGCHLTDRIELANVHVHDIYAENAHLEGALFFSSAQVSDDVFVTTCAITTPDGATSAVFQMTEEHGPVR